MPKITVAITSYQMENHIARCLDDLFAQTFRDFSVVILDDCSDDATVAIIQRYQERYPSRIHLIVSKENLGSPAKSRNAILDSGMIDGDYVIFLDGDDFLDAQFLVKLYDAAEKNDADIAICAYDRIDQASGKILCHELRWIRGCISLPSGDNAAAFLNGSLWNKLIRTRRIGSLRFPVLRAGEDVIFSARLYERCNQIACVPMELIHYQIHAASVTQKTNFSEIRAFADEMKRCVSRAGQEWRACWLLLSFLHIGLSMPLRANESSLADAKTIAKEIRADMKRSYGFYRGVGALSFRTLMRRGPKGLLIWLSLQLYRLHCFNFVLYFDVILRGVFHRDVKF